jgi:HD superfamily phosphohydrolase
MHHEEISLLIMKRLNREFKGALDTAIDIFTNAYPKVFLHQLVSGQLDVDRMDYLTRDSFFTGVSEGVIGYDRIIKMLVVHNGELMVEEKAIYSIEKFLVARRLMYWQVYLHKTVLSAEMMMVKILERVKELGARGDKGVISDEPLSRFLLGKVSGNMEDDLELFTSLDDTDVVSGLKKWSRHQDKVLATMSNALLNRELFKVRLQGEPILAEELDEKRKLAAQKTGTDTADSAYLAFTGEAVNSLYNPFDERINILFKDGSVKNISMVDNALIHQNLSRPVKKFYICYLGS